MTADPLGQVEQVQELIDKGPRGPLTFLCASLFLAVLVLFGLLMKSIRDRALERERLQAKWDLLSETLRKEHAQELSRLNREGRDMAVRTEVGLHRVLELLPVIRSLQLLAEPKEKDNGKPSEAPR